MPQPSPGVQEMFTVALRHHQAGRLAEAEGLYQRVLQADSRHVDALHFLGVIAHQNGRNDAAVELIGKAIAQNDRVPAFHNNLGNALKALGRMEEAVLSYRRALTLKPDLVAAHYNIGIALQAQGNLTEAESSYGRALALKPDHPEAHSNLGNTLQAQGKLAEAVACYCTGAGCSGRTTPRRTATSAMSSRRRGSSRRRWPHSSGRWLINRTRRRHTSIWAFCSWSRAELTDAEAAIERALAHQPNYAEAHHYLGNALREQGRVEEALACYRRALALKPDHAAARLGAAVAVIPIFADSVAESIGAVDKFSRSLDELSAWSRANPGLLARAAGSHQPFYLAYRPRDVGGLLSRYGDLVGAEAAVHGRTDDR